MLKKLSPYTLIILSFAIFILIASGILMLPIMLNDGVKVTYINSLFMATSALCVTGLSVYDLGLIYNIYGQIFILILIQLGGLGIITFSSMLLLLVSKKINYYTKKVVQEDINYNILSDIPSYIKQVAVIVFGIEILGAVMLYQEFSKIYTPLKATYYSIFHSISAFCNAGFSLYTDSLSGYIVNYKINFIIITLIIIGGLGFSTILDLFNRIKGTKRYMLLTTKFTLYVMTSLLIFGTIIVLIAEYNNFETIGNLTFSQKLLASFFESVTFRTAGFNTFSQSSMKEITKIIGMILMFIGASPGSTGGGIKTTTIGVIIIGVYYSIIGKEDIVFKNRRIPTQLYRKATAIIFISITYIITMFLILTIFEKDLMASLFELISAFGTVGLSLDYTINLHIISKIIIIFTMFIGRIGPLTIFLALSRKDSNKEKYKYPTETILIG